MKLEDIPTTLEPPTLVVTESRDTRGLDLLGLRNAALKVSLKHLNGINTITPTIRYLSLYAWIVKRYYELNDQYDSKAFLRFARKVEAAFVFANILKEPGTTNLVGGSGANDQIESGADQISLEPLVKQPASKIYAATAEDLGISWTKKRAVGLTEERGEKLADAFSSCLSNNPTLSNIDSASDSQSVPLNELAKLAETLHISSISKPEYEVLSESIIPSEPLDNEVERLRTYTLLLHLIDAAKSPLDENGILEKIASVDLKDTPSSLHRAVHGWTKYLTRDLLTACHESAVASVCHQILTLEPDTKRMNSNDVIDQFFRTADFDLSSFGYRDISPSTPINEFCDQTLDLLGSRDTSGPLCRWSSGTHEVTLANMLIQSQRYVEVATYCPLAWLLVSVRHGFFDKLGEDEFIELDAGPARLGITSIVMPKLREWIDENTPYEEACRYLLSRSVDQHLRIAWTRLAREPLKDGSVLSSDAGDWICVKPMKAGRPAARLDQALNWLKQLALTDESGLTPKGVDQLATGIEVLHNREAN